MSRSPPRAPRVTVLMPAYDAGATILEAVTSALAQTVDDLEVVVVDDGSPEPVAPILEPLDDERVRVLRTAVNVGVAAARNAAVTAARAPLVAQLDADDLWRPDHLQGLLAAFEDPRVGLAYANAEVVGHPAGFDRWISQPGAVDGPRRAVVDRQRHPVTDVRELYRGNPIPAASVVMRTEAVRAAGGYPSRLSIGEDHALYIRLLAAGWRFSFHDVASAVYRWPDPSRGVTFSRRRTVRQQIKLFAGLALASPLEPLIWKRLWSQLPDLVLTHVPGAAAGLRLLSRRRADV